MIISVWRYSHLLLAVSSFLLLTLASVTGIMLAFEPIAGKMQEYRVHGAEKLSLAEVVPLVKNNYKDLQKLNVDDNGFVVLEWTDEAGIAKKSYIDPRDGKILGAVKEQSEFFKWATALHRSLFLHETGRFLVGLASFLLILIGLSGIILVIQRQKGILRFFAHIERLNWAQYYHVVFGRVVLFPIIFIAATGTYLTVTRFEWINAAEAKLQAETDNLAEEPAHNVKDFPLFRELKLSALQSLEFPFSEFPEDYYTIRLHDRVAMVNQFTGNVIAGKNYSTAAKLSAFSLRWHTGRNGIIWAIVLAISSGYILFFIYSGFVIMWRRRANVLKNKFKPDESPVVILVGSENGTTMRFARAAFQQLVTQGKKVYLTDMDKYRSFPLMEQLIVMTSTYGLGDPPSNANHFSSRLSKYPQDHVFGFSVLAFGSRTYADYCKFGLEADLMLSHKQWASRSTEVFTVNDRSPEDFAAWCNAWSQHTGMTVSLTPDLIGTENHKDLRRMIVKDKTVMAAADDTFLIRLTPPKKARVRSGDLLAIYPANDHRERLYSIGTIDKEIQLSVKYYHQGLASTFLDALSSGTSIQARIVKNEHFHFPVKASSVIMISNGTGIAPFLGMISDNKKKVPVHLYCGFRFQRSFVLYEDFLLEQKAAGQLESLHLALSREGAKEYVMTLLSRSAAKIGSLLASGGVVMICGSLAMQKDVLEVLGDICKAQAGLDVDTLHLNGKILTDCY
ncbi:PepSY domain-containing protein [Flavitalea sp.]|nr:PepSY domain-containing protein [Flavitalea sp.]